MAFWGKKRSGQKYNNESSLCALGHSHRSKLESSVCQILQIRERAGEIKILGAEVRCLICGPEGHPCDHKQKIEYIADFQYQDVKTGNVCFAEAKGFVDHKWPIKKRLWIHYRTEKLEIWTGTHLKPVLSEVING